MKIRITRLLFLVLTAIIVLSCQEPFNGLENSISNSSKAQYSDKVSLEEAKNVALLYNQEVSTRSVKTIDNLTTIYDFKGNPAIYVINFNNKQGFLLVSATKKFYPILAHADEGDFDLANFIPDGVNNWLACMQTTIQTVQTLPFDSTRIYRSLWERYKIPQKKATTRGTELNDYITTCRHQWEAEGYTYNNLYSLASSLPDDIYNRFCSIAEGTVFPLYDYMESFVLCKEYSYPVTVNNFVNVTWDQTNSFNDKYDRINGELPPAGCMPVAVAQVLRHYQHPTFFAWSSMPSYNYATSQSAELMKNIATAVHAKPALDGTSASLQDARNALVNNYSFSSTARIVNHTTATTIGELENRRPVIMQGFSDDGKSGHAWICSGYDKANGYVEYELQVLIYEFEFAKQDSYRENEYSYEQLYMNWGWGGAYNGFYSDKNVWIGMNNGDKWSFNRNRKDIIGIIPN